MYLGTYMLIYSARGSREGNGI